MKTVALKNPRNGTFQMVRLSNFGTISSDDRENYGTRVSLGNVKTSLDLKESRIVTLEDDKVVKDSKISALESDKNTKDTKISDIESDMTSLTSRVSTLESSGFDTSDLATKVSLGNLATRVSSLETLGISGISNAVSWTNLSEINVGGQTITSGGTVQAYAGGGLEKISGASGYNSGGFSVNYIPGNSDGYFQFQLAQNNKALRVGLVYADADYSTVSPFGLDFNATGNIDNMNPYQDNITTYAQGDWFRVRHYASSNQVHFQKRQTVYSQNTNFVFETASGSNYSYPSASRPLVISLDGTGTLTIGELYEVYTIRASDQALYLRDLDGNAHGYHGQGTRGIRFEVVEEAGQDYVTFLTSSTTTNGSDLHLDVAFDSVGGRINDVTIVT